MDHAGNITMDMASLNETLSPTGINSTENTIRMVKMVIASAILVVGIFGLIGNFLNLMVLTRMGFSETIHMSYAAMAVTDLGSLLTLIYISVNNLTRVIVVIFASYGLRTDTAVFMSYTASWPHLTFSRVTALLTAWISLERCLCVIIPTKVKVFIIPKVTKVVLGVIHVIGFCPVVARYVGIKSRVIFHPERNITTFQLYYNTENSISVLNSVAFALYGAIYPLTSWIVVTVCAVFLIVKLKQSAKWRFSNSHVKSTVAQAGNSRSMTARKETRVTKTVVIIASVFVITAIPTSSAILIPMFEREYSVRGSFREFVIVHALVSFLANAINSSLNFVIYVFTGSKFRAALLELFAGKPRKI